MPEQGENTILPEFSELFAQNIREVLLDTVRRAIIGVACEISERKSLLPREFRCESPSETAGIPAMLTDLPLSPLLLRESHSEEIIHMRMSFPYKLLVDPVIDNYEEPMLLARFMDYGHCLRECRRVTRQKVV